MGFEEDLKRSLELTRELIEKEFQDRPKELQKFRHALDTGFSAYTEEADLPPLAEQSVVLDTEKLKRAIRIPNYSELPIEMSNPVEVFMDRQFSEIEFERISFGLEPASMDEKWIVLAEGDSVYFNRSWPPHDLIFRLEIFKSGDTYSMSTFFVAGQFLQKQWNDTEYTKAFLNYLVERLLLGRYLNFPFPEAKKSEAEKAAFRHSMVGSSVSNGETRVQL